MSRLEKNLKRIARSLGVDYTADDNTSSEVLDKIGDSLELIVIDMDTLMDESTYPSNYHREEVEGGKIGYLDISKVGEYLLTNFSGKGVTDLGVSYIRLCLGSITLPDYTDLKYAKPCIWSTALDFEAAVVIKNEQYLDIYGTFVGQLVGRPLFVKVTPNCVYVSRPFGA